MPKPRPAPTVDQIRAREAARVTLTYCLDMLARLDLMILDGLPETDDPHGMRKGWLIAAQRNLEHLLEDIIKAD